MNQSDEVFFPRMPVFVLDFLPESVRYYICFLEATVSRLEQQIQEQAQKIHELEADIAKNNSNGGKPPVVIVLRSHSKLLVKE